MVERFLNLPAHMEDDSVYRVVMVPYEESTGYLKGTSAGPTAIVEESQNVEPFDAWLGVNAAQHGIETLELKKYSPEKSFPLDLKQKFSVILGGEHTITLSPALSLKKKLIVLDAHLDVRETYMGKELSHATWLRKAIEKGIEARIFGWRSVSEEEYAWALERGILGKDVGEVEGEEIYLSIDLDVLDISAMPCCSNPEPAGLSWKELFNTLESLFKRNKVVAADIVEHRPCPGLRQYSYAVSLLAYRLFCLKQKYG